MAIVLTIAITVVVLTMIGCLYSLVSDRTLRGPGARKKELLVIQQDLSEMRSGMELIYKELKDLKEQVADIIIRNDGYV